MKLKNIIGLAGIYSMITIFAVIFQLLSYFQTGIAMLPYVFPWSVTLGLLYMADCLLLRKGITVEKFLYFNIATGVIYIVLANILFSNLSGVLARIFASLLIGITIGMAEENARAEVKTNQLLLELEISFVVLAIVLFFEDTSIIPASLGRVYMILSIIFDLCALVLARTLVSKDGVTKQDHPVRGMLTLGCLVAVLLGAGSCFVVCSTEVGRPILEWFVSVSLRSFFRVIAIVNEVTIRLVNAIPGYQSKGKSILIDPVDTPGPQYQQYKVEFNIQFFMSIFLTILIVIFFVFVIRFLFKKFAKLRLNQEMVIKEDEERVERHRGSILQKVKGYLKNVAAIIILQWKIFRYPNSPEAMLIKAERIGKKYHLLKNVSESPGGYLRRLAQNEKMIETGMADLFLKQAKEMDLYFYAPSKRK